MIWIINHSINIYWLTAIMPATILRAGDAEMEKQKTKKPEATLPP